MDEIPTASVRITLLVVFAEKATLETLIISMLDAVQSPLLVTLQPIVPPILIATETFVDVSTTYIHNMYYVYVQLFANCDVQANFLAYCADNNKLSFSFSIVFDG